MRKVTEAEQEQIKELISVLLILSKEDKAVLLSNAATLKARQELEERKKLSSWQVRV